MHRYKPAASRQAAARHGAGSSMKEQDPQA
jgi:hypothetical protein